MSHVQGFRPRASSGQPLWPRSRACQWLALTAVAGTLVTLIAVGALHGRPTPQTATSSELSRSDALGRNQPAPTIDLTRVPSDLSVEDQLRFITGRSFFSDSWVRSGATTTLRDGLGPLYSARSCATCHQGGGRSTVTYQNEFADAAPGALTLRFDDQDALASGVVQASELPLGTTWQAFAVPEAQAPGSGQIEGEVQIRSKPLIWHYPDGSTTGLRRPEVRLRNAPENPAAMSARVAPGLEHLRLIEAVDSAAILANADPEDNNADGISGRMHPLMNRQGDGLAGRFGLKARHPSLREQVGAALQEDIGITSSVRPDQACGHIQTACRLAPDGRGAGVGGLPVNVQAVVHEISDDNLSALLHFLRHLSVPQTSADPQISASGEGRKLFAQSGCAQCHVPSLAGDANHPEQLTRITLYSDLLLHDMGQALADQGPAAGTLGREWRTAPLAQIRLRSRLSKRANYLHDGRARTPEEAILWHGGEARKSRDRFSSLSHADRRTLLRFVETR